MTDTCELDMDDHEAGQDPVPAGARLRVCYRAHRRAPLLAVGAHALPRRRIGPIVVRSANSTSGSCKHQGGHDGVDTRTAGPGVIHQRDCCEPRGRIHAKAARKVRSERTTALALDSCWLCLHDGHRIVSSRTVGCSASDAVLDRVGVKRLEALDLVHDRIP